MPQKINVFQTLNSLFDSLSGRIAEIANARIKESGKFDFVITGGQSAIALYEQLCLINTDWGAWRIFWTDERSYPINHPDRNSHQADVTWLQHVSIPSDQIFQIPTELGVQMAAVRYSEIIARHAPFDLVLLSLGTDGHIASIFGNDERLRDASPAVAVLDAPKDPPKRVSMSIESLARTKTLFLLCVGEGKDHALSAHLAGALQPSTRVTQLCEHEFWTDRRFVSG
jgi:6-phosphogluconolactonase